MMRLKNIKIKTKLIVTFIMVTLIASIAGIFSVSYTGKVNEEYSEAITIYGFSQGDIAKLMACLGSVNVGVHDIIGYVEEDSMKMAQEKYNTQLAKMDGYFQSVESTLVLQEVKSEFNTAKQTWSQYLTLAEELMKAADTTDIQIVGDVQQRVVQELDPLYDTIYNSLANVLYSKVDSGYEVEAKLTRGINYTRVFVVVLIVAAIIISLIMSFKISNGIANPIHECAERLRKLAEGDLKSPVPQYDGKDESGILVRSTNQIVTGLTEIIADEKYLLSAMADGNFDIHSRITDKYVGDFEEVLLAVRRINHKLSDALGQIKQCSEQVTSGSSQVSNAAQNLSQGAAEQASSIEVLTATVEAISEQIKNNAANSMMASQKAEEAGREMENSNAKMQNMTSAMEEITESSSEIGKIIKTIEDIAFQTNILALNAAVEAARAGEAGKGFAVVADEVRNLASKSAEASKNTAQLIESSIRAVENGTKIADETAEALKKTVGGVEAVVKLAEKISSASSEQSRSVERVTQSMEQISSVVQTNSATSEESAAASEELYSQAQVLKSLVEQFSFRQD